VEQNFSVTCVTGARQQVSAGLETLINLIKVNTSTPVCVGFGIGAPEQARQVAIFADGVIVGSACEKTIGESANPVEEAKQFAREFAEAMKLSNLNTEIFLSIPSPQTNHVFNNVIFPLSIFNGGGTSIMYLYSSWSRG